MSTGENQGGGGEWRPPNQGEWSTGPSGQNPPPPPPNNPWGNTAGQPQWQPPYAGQGGGGGAPIPNHLVWAILSTLFCCLPFGIVSIVFSTQVNTKQAQGDYAGAMDASRKAKTWAIASAVSGLVLTALLFGFGLLGALVPTSQNAGF